MNTIPKALVIGLITLCFTVGASAATFVVNTTADTADVTPGDGNCADTTPACSLRAAISEANALAGADIITLPAGTYTQALVAANEDLNAGGDWDVTSQLTINGAGEATTFIQANASPGVATERVINVRAGANLTLTGMTVRNGRFNGTMAANTRGAGIENVGVLTLTNVTVRDNQVTSTSGNPISAGIHNGGTAVTLTNSTITANVNTRSVGVAGSSSAFGGGMASITAATIIIDNSTISGNSAISTSAIAGFGFGAGLYLENVFNVTATNSHFDNNTGSGTLTAGSNGNGVRALSSVGAAVFNATNCTFNNNVGTGGSSNQGTGLQLFTSVTAAATLTSTLDKVSINGNSGNSVGIGLNATVVGGNMSLSILNSTISGNTGGLNGGGMLISNNGGLAGSTGTINLTNSTVSGHNVTGAGGGIALEQPIAAVLTVNANFSTIANNRANNDNSGAADNGGGIVRASGTFNLKNSIVADNSVGTGSTGPDISGTVNSQNYNHIEDLTGAVITGTTTNNTTGDVGLGSLANNGGPTLTHLPGSSPSVLNAIPPSTNDCGSPITTEQRGLVTRPSGAGCEKGSVEVSSIAPGPWDLSGFIRDANGRPIRNVLITVTGGSLPQPLTTVTGMLGQYVFFDLPGGTYTVTVKARRFTFTPNNQVVVLGSDMTAVNFVANEGFGVQPPPKIANEEP